MPLILRSTEILSTLYKIQNFSESLNLFPVQGNRTLQNHYALANPKVFSQNHFALLTAHTPVRSTLLRLHLHSFPYILL